MFLNLNIRFNIFYLINSFISLCNYNKRFKYDSITFLVKLGNITSHCDSTDTLETFLLFACIKM